MRRIVAPMVNVSARIASWAVLATRAPIEMPGSFEELRSGELLIPPLASCSFFDEYCFGAAAWLKSWPRCIGWWAIPWD